MLSCLLPQVCCLRQFPLLWFTLCNISFTGFLDVENGHTLHLVERQPAQSQPSSGASSGEADGNNSTRGINIYGGACLVFEIPHVNVFY